MAEEQDKPDRFASGTGSANNETAERDDLRPGVTGGGRNYLPQSGRADESQAGASSAEGTIGAVGEMDLTGAPTGTTASSGASSSGESEGGGPGGGSTSSGGTGPG